MGSPTISKPEDISEMHEATNNNVMIHKIVLECMEINVSFILDQGTATTRASAVEWWGTCSIEAHLFLLFLCLIYLAS